MTQTYLAKDKFSHPIQSALKPGIVTNVTVSQGGSNKMAAALLGDCNVVRLVATVDTYVSIGLFSTVDSSTVSMFLPANRPELFRVDEASTSVASWGVAGQSVGVSAGILQITQML